MSKPQLTVVDTFFAAQFGKRGELRQPVGRSGRIHIDRWLPFIVLHRSATPETSLARKVAINSPAYLIWSPEDDVTANRAFEVVADALHKKFGCLLVIEVDDAPWKPVQEGTQALPSFEIRLTASDGAHARQALDRLAQAFEEVCIDLREPTIKIQKDRSVTGLHALEDQLDRLTVVIPQTHRKDETTFFPQVTRELALAVGDALLQAACEFMSNSETGSPPHFRSLGRSAFLAAALDADTRLDKVAKSFDFLLSVSPINSREAMDRFFATGEESPPNLRYRPLTVDPDAAKRDLYAVDLSIIEDPLLERLLSEKRQELDHQLTMLATRNTTAFRGASMMHYGPVSPRLLADAHTILALPRPRKSGGQKVDATHVAKAARALVSKYQAIDESFNPTIEIRDDVASLLVSGRKLMIASSTSMQRSRVDALLSHEISVHLLTHFNGATQGLTVFRTGLAHYEGLQEGLGVFAEWAVGGLSPARLRLLAGRVVAVDAMLDGGEFVEVYRELVDGHGLSRRSAFDIATRVFRSGGFAKDSIYLKGFQDVIGLVAKGASLDPFWIGKIARDHVGAIEELLQRSLIRPPHFKPEFLQREDVQDRIARLRDETSFAKILDVE